MISTCIIVKGRVYSGAKYRLVPNTFYLASTAGQLVNGETGQEIKPQRHYKGYTQIKFGFRTYYVHRLVCAAFHGPAPFPNAEVDHLDGVKDNNAPNNLRWVTSKENKANIKLRWASKKATRYDDVPF